MSAMSAIIPATAITGTPQTTGIHITTQTIWATTIPQIIGVRFMGIARAFKKSFARELLIFLSWPILIIFAAAIRIPGSIAIFVLLSYPAYLFIRVIVWSARNSF